MLPGHAVQTIVQQTIDAVGNACERIARRGEDAAAEYARPSTVLRPRLSIDGDKWCALHGENLQDGVAGFGDSPSEAYFDFDREWHTKLAASSTPRGPAATPESKEE